MKGRPRTSWDERCPWCGERLEAYSGDQYTDGRARWWCGDSGCLKKASKPKPLSGRFPYVEFATLRRGDKLVWVKTNGVLVERRVLSAPGPYSRRVGAPCVKVERVQTVAFEKPFNLYRYEELEHRVAGVIRR